MCLDTDQKLILITSYYDGCTRGDVDLMKTTLHPDVAHYFLAPNIGTKPVRGPEHLARYWRKVQRLIDARWVVDRIVAEGAEAVIEFTMFWRPVEHGRRIMMRGAEWYSFDDGLIREIRAYYQQGPETTELEAFPYADRGYSSLASPSSRVHASTGGALEESSAAE